MTARLWGIAKPVDRAVNLHPAVNSGNFFTEFAATASHQFGQRRC
jgi:hypothetical protein